MPFVGDDVASTRKRRRDGDDATDFLKMHSQEKQQDIYLLDQHEHHHQPPSLMPTRRILPLTKRTKLSTDNERPLQTNIHTNHLNYYQNNHRRRSSSTSLPSTNTPQHKVLQDPPSLANKASRTAGSLLEPCHICHRKPVKRSDLDGYADCHGCGQRTCFVCIRECQGWSVEDGSGSVLSEQEVLSRSFHMDDVDDDDNNHDDDSARKQGWPAVKGRASDMGDDARCLSENDRNRRKMGWDAGGHRSVVCSRCCIERGAEGDVACLGCLSRMEGA